MLAVAALPVSVSAPPAPVIVMVSVPAVKVLTVQPEMSNVASETTLTTNAVVKPVPVTVTVFEMRPVPNCAELKVAVEVPEVLA